MGAEVDNPKWKKLWENKVAYNGEGEPQIRVVKGTVDTNKAAAEQMLDGLSGATITANVVLSLVNFWLGEYGYGKVIIMVNLEGAI